MAEEDEKIPAIPVEDEVLSLDELMEIYLGAYNWPYPVETIEDMRKLARKIIEIETELKKTGVNGRQSTMQINISVRAVEPGDLL